MTMRMRQQGFTLVELVIAIVLSSILSMVAMQFSTVPVEMYTDQARRALVWRSVSASS